MHVGGGGVLARGLCAFARASSSYLQGLERQGRDLGVQGPAAATTPGQGHEAQHELARAKEHAHVNTHT